MTIADFLYQAGFWQWIGIIALAAIASRFRLWTTTTKTKNIYTDKETPK